MNQPNGPPSPPSYRRDSMDSPKTNRSFLKVPGLPKLTAMDLTPASTPILRHRLVSIGSPLPVVKLLADSLLSKVASLKQLLENKLLLSVLEEADHLMPLTGTGTLHGPYGRPPSWGGRRPLQLPILRGH